MRRLIQMFLAVFAVSAVAEIILASLQPRQSARESLLFGAGGAAGWIFANMMNRNEDQEEDEDEP